MTHITLDQAMAASPTIVYLDRQKWGGELFDKAVEHHRRRKLRADIEKGSTRDVDGWRSQFTAYDWGHEYADAPHHIYFDFFRGTVNNSCSRIQRGLEP